MNDFDTNSYLCSVVVPSYNRAKFLTRTIKSIDNQDCIDKYRIEILLIDDGSTDETPTIISNFKKTKLNQELKYVRVSHVGEPGTVRNIALNLSQGEFVAYCDSDDFWLPHHLATAFQYFKKNPDAGMVSNFWALSHFCVLPNGEIKTSIIVPPHPNTSVNTNCRVHKRICIKKVGLFNTSKWGEDQDFFQRIENNFRTIKTGIVTSVNGYIKGGNNISFEFDKGIKNKYF